MREIGVMRDGKDKYTWGFYENGNLKFFTTYRVDNSVPRVGVGDTVLYDPNGCVTGKLTVVSS